MQLESNQIARLAAAGVIAFCGTLVSSSPRAAADLPLGTAFTYQGDLQQGGTPVDEPVDGCAFEFSLWNDPIDGAPAAQVGSTLMQTELVDGGRFTATLDFGANIFTGQARWLEIAVCCPAPCGPPTTLSPRQELTPAPHALALPGMYMQQHPSSPNLIGGYSGNVMQAGVAASTISGGGSAGSENRVYDSGGTVSGGSNNAAGSDDGSPGSAQLATVGGGLGNQASGDKSTVGGGWANIAGGQLSTVAGGESNSAGGLRAAVGGGLASIADADYAVVAGGRTNRIYDLYGVIGGGLSNVAGIDDGNQENQQLNTVAGGQSNVASANNATVGGGRSNTASSTYTTVAGGFGNTASGGAATVAGGEDNSASGSYTAVSGGLNNTATTQYANVGGGVNNIASNDNATVAGGNGNTASAISATVGGGGGSTASGNYGIVAGGLNNRVFDHYGSIGGGQGNVSGTDDGNSANSQFNTVGGGQNNVATNNLTTVGGGKANTASGTHATVPGGHLNTAAGATSLAAGQRAQANHNGTFVWSDNTTVDPDFFSSTGPDQFLVMAAGGMGVGTNSPSELLTVAGKVESTTGGFKFPDGTVQTTAAAGGGGGNTLDAAYDQGGAGAGRFITADNGAVEIAGTFGLEVTGNIHTDGTLSSGSSIVIDGTTDSITATSGTIDFDDENLITSGQVEIENGAANTTLTLEGGTGGSGSTITLNNGDGTTPIDTVLIDGDDLGGGIIKLNNGNSPTPVETVVIDGDFFNGGMIRLREGNGTTKMLFDADFGEIGLHNQNGNERLELDGDNSGAGQITVRAVDGSNTIRLTGEGANSGGLVSVRNDTGVETISLIGDNSFDRALLNVTGSLRVSESVGIGTDSPFGRLNIVRNGDSPILRVECFANTIDSAIFSGIRGRGTESAPEAVFNGDILADYLGGGYDGNSFDTDGAAIRINASGNWADGTHPAGIAFFTTPFGSENFVARMKIADDGNVGIWSAAPIAKLDVRGDVRVRSDSGVQVDNSSGSPRAAMRIGGDRGELITYGTNGSVNFRAIANGLALDTGAILIADAAGTQQAGMYIDSVSNLGIVWGDTKSFRIPNPADPETEIWYASIEGPEAAAYIRGTATLQNGTATVALPEHFGNVATIDGMTVHLTPLSSASKGLAVVEKTLEGVVVEELAGGTGTYDFDYMVMAVRQGHENFKVIRPALSLETGDTEDIQEPELSEDIQEDELPEDFLAAEDASEDDGSAPGEMHAEDASAGVSDPDPVDASNLERELAALRAQMEERIARLEQQLTKLNETDGSER